MSSSKGILGWHLFCEKVTQQQQQQRKKYEFPIYQEKIGLDVNLGIITSRFLGTYRCNEDKKTEEKKQFGRNQKVDRNQNIERNKNVKEKEKSFLIYMSNNE